MAEILRNAKIRAKDNGCCTNDVFLTSSDTCSVDKVRVAAMMRDRRSRFQINIGCAVETT